MQKIEREAPGLLSLAKKAQFAVSRHGLEGVSAKVALVLDRSGSAAGLYDSGTMQKAAERILAVATQFDDDGSIDVFGFHDSAFRVGDLTLSNYQGGINQLFRRKSQYGGTDYGAAIGAVTSHFFAGGMFSKRPDLSVPVYVAFLTDGMTQNQRKALEAGRESSNYPIFFQTVGIGDPYHFDFIKKQLNNHGGRLDNFGFFSTPDIGGMPDGPLLDGLLNEFPGWITRAREEGVLR